MSDECQLATAQDRTVAVCFHAGQSEGGTPDDLSPMTPAQTRLVFGLHDALCLRALPISGGELPTVEQNQSASLVSSNSHTPQNT